MYFGLNEDQELIDQSLRSFLGDKLTLEDVRRIAETHTGFDSDIWNGLSELGIPGLLIPEDYGGSGLSLLDAAVVAEALGYYAAPVPFIANSVMAPKILEACGSDDQRQRYLPGIASGGIRLSVGFGNKADVTGENSVHFNDNRIASGRITGLLDSSEASHAIIASSDGAIGIIDLSSNQVDLTPRPTIDRTRPLADLVLKEAAVEILSDGEKAKETIRMALDTGRLMLSADTLGASYAMIDKAVAYAGERVQFGRLISSFQAIKHLCAEMIATVEPCKSLVWYSAHISEENPEERHIHASLTKAHLAEVGRDIARSATEVHGGMGFTELMGLHFWFKRIGFSRQTLGGPEACREDAILAQGWSSG